MKSLQETYAPHGICFGCGVMNEKGLRIRSFQENGEFVCDWRAQPHHQAFPGMVNGGIIGSLLDCHCNWAAAVHLMQKNGKAAPDCTVTAEYTIKLLAPTPFDRPLRLRARVLDSSARRANVEGELSADGTVCATCTGVFVTVKEGHPAYHNWG